MIIYTANHLNLVFMFILVAITLSILLDISVGVVFFLIRYRSI